MSCVFIIQNALGFPAFLLSFVIWGVEWRSAYHGNLQESDLIFSTQAMKQNICVVWAEVGGSPSLNWSLISFQQAAF